MGVDPYGGDPIPHTNPFTPFRFRKVPSLDAETQRGLTDACWPGLEALGYET